MLITGIRAVKKGLALLYIDGEPAVRIDRDVLLLSSVKEGQVLTDDQLYELIKNSDERRAREKALYLLERRNHSKKELIDKISLVLPKSAAEHAANRMEEIGLIDDKSFAEMYAREMFSRKMLGKRRVEQELNIKGIDKEIIEEIFASEDFIEETKNGSNNVEIILQRRYSTWREDEKIKRRAAAALQRKGYSWDEIRRAMDNINSMDE